jgi:cyclic nucleotide gated channel
MCDDVSTFGNALSPSNNVVEIIFSILVVTCGLLLFSMLIGNIQAWPNLVIVS